MWCQFRVCLVSGVTRCGFVIENLFFGGSKSYTFSVLFKGASCAACDGAGLDNLRLIYFILGG